MLNGISIPVAALNALRPTSFDDLRDNVFPIAQEVEFIRRVAVVAHAAMRRRDPDRRRRLFGFLLAFLVGAAWDNSAA